MKKVENLWFAAVYQPVIQSWHYRFPDQMRFLVCE